MPTTSYTASTMPFGHVCVDRGYVTPEQVQWCLEQQTQQREAGNYFPIGYIMQRYSMVRPDQVLRALHQQGIHLYRCHVCGGQWNVLGDPRSIRVVCPTDHVSINLVVPDQCRSLLVAGKLEPIAVDPRDTGTVASIPDSLRQSAPIPVEEIRRAAFGTAGGGTMRLDFTPAGGGNDEIAEPVPLDAEPADSAVSMLDPESQIAVSEGLGATSQQPSLTESDIYGATETHDVPGSSPVNEDIRHSVRLPVIRPDQTKPVGGAQPGFTESLAWAFKWTPAQTNAFLQTLVDLVAEALVAGRPVELRNVGTLTRTDASDDDSEGREPYRIPSDAFAEAVVEALPLEADVATDAATRLLEEVVKRLRHNEAVKLTKFIGFKIVEEPPSIADEPVSGRRIIQPGQKSLGYQFHPAFKARIGSPLLFQPTDALRHNVESIQTAAVLLGCPRPAEGAEGLEKAFTDAGWHVETFHDTGQLRERIRRDTHCIVILDDRLSGHNDFCEALKLAPNTTFIPVFTLHQEAPPEKVKGFTLLSNESFVHPVAVKDLINRAKAELQRSVEEQVVFHQAVRFQFPTTDDNVDRANEVFAELLTGSRLADAAQVSMCAAFREGVGNAAQHGNRHRRDRIVDIYYLLDANKVTCVIQDEGKGFDWSLYIDASGSDAAVERARQRHKQGKLGGLGIMLITKCADKIEYNDAGNRLTIYKDLTTDDATESTSA